MTSFRAVVLENFRHPRNRGALEQPSGDAEGANPLCGDRVRVQVLVAGGAVADARFTADACAVCIASASLLTERVRGQSVTDAAAIDARWLYAALDGEPPSGRQRCALLPLDTLHRALASAQSGAR